jgi:hypothetical protein
MSGKKQFTDYVAEFEDCMEVLDGDLPEYEDIDSDTFKPKSDDRKRMGINILFEDDDDVDEGDPIFDIGDHWVGMPEYEVTSLMPYKQLIVNFQTQEDMIAFGKMVGRKITPKTKSIWWPEREPIATTSLRWVDGRVLDDE